jgi:hypothetical protein
MIVASTNYDPETSVLEEIASNLAQLAGGRLTTYLDSGSPAHARAIQGALNPQDGTAFVFFGHGRLAPGELLAQDQQAAIDATNQHLLANRLVFAFACHSAVTLTPAAQSDGATVVGYNAKLKIPMERRYRRLFRNTLLAGIELMISDATKTVDDARKAMGAMWQTAARQLLIKGSVPDQIVLLRVFDPNEARLSISGNLQRTL